jgi:hypothetical protein
MQGFLLALFESWYCDDLGFCSAGAVASLGDEVILVVVFLGGKKSVICLFVLLKFMVGF